VSGTTCLVFSPDSKYLAGYNRDDDRIRFWDAKTGKLAIDNFIGESYGNGKIAFSPDGSLLASIHNGRQHRMYLWDWKQNRELARLDGLHQTEALAFASDGKTLAILDLQTIYLYAVEKRKVLHTIAHRDGGSLARPAFSPDGRKLAVSSLVHRRLHIFDCETGAKEKVFKADEAAELGPFWVVHWKKDDKSIIAIDVRHGISFWDADSGKRIRQFAAPLKEFNNSVSISPDEKLIAAGTVKEHMLLWDLTTSKHGKLLDSRLPAFSPDGKLVAVLTPADIRIWETSVLTAMLGK
jgi:WD40 repeat protein